MSGGRIALSRGLPKAGYGGFDKLAVDPSGEWAMAGTFSSLLDNSFLTGWLYRWSPPAPKRLWSAEAGVDGGSFGWVPARRRFAFAKSGGTLVLVAPTVSRHRDREIVPKREGYGPFGVVDGSSFFTGSAYNRVPVPPDFRTLRTEGGFPLANAGVLVALGRRFVVEMQFADTRVYAIGRGGTLVPIPGAHDRGTAQVAIFVAADEDRADGDRAAAPRS